eukprot:CAMPEP_0180216946 /NCGR_PEP_ID=MMETSP0987-20121128/16600_1 /TAXON_ID=697907 /ORGANISM="non described non described, Strain CCMP2293" /LENGTH=359 /DNA_ID=CAMNT_0022176305 /DNA_START=2 /DNA_END=1081 /DNA_ORIENTATION=-
MTDADGAATPWWYHIGALVPAVVVVTSVLSQSKNISALAQLGNLESRSLAEDGIARKDDNDVRTKRIEEAKNLIKDKDRLYFTLATFNIGFTCFLFGRFPQYFYMWHVPKVFILVFIRYILFRAEQKQLLLLDFCYWANWLSVYYLIFSPTDGELFQVLFLVANGPLAWSILAFQQSIVLHSPQHMISVFIHISPMMLTLGLRWSPSDFVVLSPPGVSDAPFDLVWRALTRFYLPWSFMYYAWVFVFLADSVKKRGLQTLFDRVLSMAPFLSKIRDPTAHQFVRKAVYLTIHALFGSIVMLFAALMYHSEAAHWAFAVAVCCASAWNGAGFYSKVWATRYHQEVEEAAHAHLGVPKKSK